MANKEAIEILKRKTTIPNDGESFDTINEAFDLAIKALEQMDVLDKIRAEIKSKAESGQWSEPVKYGMLKAMTIIDKYRKEQE